MSFYILVPLLNYHELYPFDLDRANETVRLRTVRLKIGRIGKRRCENHSIKPVALPQRALYNAEAVPIWTTLAMLDFASELVRSMTASPRMATTGAWSFPLSQIPPRRSIRRDAVLRM